MQAPPSKGLSAYLFAEASLSAYLSIEASLSAYLSALNHHYLAPHHQTNPSMPCHHEASSELSPR